MTLEDVADNFLREENPTAEAVKSLINVKSREVGKADSEVELKTDLSEDEVKIHSVLDLLSNVLEMDEKVFSSKCILSDLVHKKERKSLSKNRQSRQEIVAVARQPDMNMGMMDGAMATQTGFIKRFFTGKKNAPQ